MFCFLLMAYVFYMRHSLADVLFHRRRVSHILPLIGVLGAVLCFGSYQVLLEGAVSAIKNSYQYSNNGPPTTSQILDEWPFDKIPDGLLLTALYVSAFVFAEFAFVIMATREYMQDVLAINEVDLYAGRGVPTSSRNSNAAGGDILSKE